MIPLGDVGPRLRRRAFVTWGLVLANILIYLWMSAGDAQRNIYGFALVPGNLTGRNPTKWISWRVEHLRPLSGTIVRSRIQYQAVPASSDFRRPQVQAELRIELAREEKLPPRSIHLVSEERPRLPAVLTLFTSMFLHGGLMHILGNLLFLAVFGRRLEDRLGRSRFLVFYLLTGCLAGLGHAFSDPLSTVPTVGASGAIAGVLGGYVLLWPRARILTLIPIFILIYFLEIPAIIFIGVWVAKEVLRVGHPGSVAVWAHLVGFLYGVLLVRFFEPHHPRVTLGGRRPIRPWRPGGGSPFR